MFILYCMYVCMHACTYFGLFTYLFINFGLCMALLNASTYVRICDSPAYPFLCLMFICCIRVLFLVFYCFCFRYISCFRIRYHRLLINIVYFLIFRHETVLMHMVVLLSFKSL